MAKSRVARLQAHRELLRQIPYLSDQGFGAWELPATGGYAGGCETGDAAARAYLKLLRETVRLNLGDIAGRLQCVAIDMLLGKASTDSRRGQAVAFFSQLERALILGAQLMPTLDDHSFGELAQKMQHGCARSKVDDDADLNQWRSEHASRGWKTRRARLKVKRGG